MRDDIHFEVRVRKLLARQRGAHATKHRTDPGDQLTGAERLGDIIVGTGLEAPDPIAFLAAGGQHHDRDVARGRPAAKAAAHFDPADPLDHPVEQDDVRAHLVDEDQGFLPVAGARYAVTGALEMEGDEVRKGPVVLNQKQVLGGHEPSSPTSPAGRSYARQLRHNRPFRQYWWRGRRRAPDSWR